MMLRTTRITFAFALIWHLMSYTITAQSLEDEVQAFVMQYMEDYNSGNGAAVAQHFTEDAIMIRPDNGILKGRGDINSYYDQFFSQVTSTTDISITDVAGMPGNHSFTMGTYKLNNTLQADGKTMKVEGTYGVLSRKVNGSWKITRMLLMIPIPPQS